MNQNWPSNDVSSFDSVLILSYSQMLLARRNENACLNSLNNSSLDNNLVEKAETFSSLLHPDGEQRQANILLKSLEAEKPTLHICTMPGSNLLGCKLL